jgi:hypothetical protein
MEIFRLPVMVNPGVHPEPIPSAEWACRSQRTSGTVTVIGK